MFSNSIPSRYLFTLLVDLWMEQTILFCIRRLSSPLDISDEVFVPSPHRSSMVSNIHPIRSVFFIFAYLTEILKCHPIPCFSSLVNTHLPLPIVVIEIPNLSCTKDKFGAMADQRDVLFLLNLLVPFIHSVHLLLLQQPHLFDASLHMQCLKHTVTAPYFAMKDTFLHEHVVEVAVHAWFVVINY